MTWIFFLWILIPYLTGSEDMKVYQVKKIDAAFELSGKGDEALWNQAALLTDFQLPWSNELAEPTSFRALWNDDHYYFLYEVIDLDIIAPGSSMNKRNVLPSDRIEIFFKSNGGMDPYYCIEMDAKGRVLDYIARYYRNTDLDWSWPEGGLEVKATMKKDGYIVEGKISLTSLKELGILNQDLEMEAGLFRGDFYRISANKTDVRWVSWVTPKADQPDFHIPSAFGKLVLDQ